MGDFDHEEFDISSSKTVPTFEMDASLLDEDLKAHTEILNEAFSTALTRSNMLFSSVKQRLLSDKERELQARDMFYTDQLQKQQVIVQRMSRDLAVAQQQGDRDRQRFEVISANLGSEMASKRALFTCENSAIKIFYKMREKCLDVRRLKQLFMLTVTSI